MIRAQIITPPNVMRHPTARRGFLPGPPPCGLGPSSPRDQTSSVMSGRNVVASGRTAYGANAPTRDRNFPGSLSVVAGSLRRDFASRSASSPESAAQRTSCPDSRHGVVARFGRSRRRWRRLPPASTECIPRPPPASADTPGSWVPKRESDDGNMGPEPSDRSGRLDASEPGHPHVHHDHIG